MVAFVKKKSDITEQDLIGRPERLQRWKKWVVIYNRYPSTVMMQKKKRGKQPDF